MISRSDRMANAMAFGTKKYGFEDAMLGTFIPENRNEPGCFASMEFTPEIAEEGVRLVRSDRLRRFVPLDQIVDPRTDGYVDIEGAPLVPKLTMSLQDGLRRLLAAGPRYAVLVYTKACEQHRDDILALLPGVVAELVASGVYNAQEFQQMRGVGQSLYRTLKGYAKSCPVAKGMIHALASAA